MTDPKSSEPQLKELQETIRILSLENEALAERAEDAILLGLIAEKINHLEDAGSVVAAGLEQISLLKDISLCACCRIIDGIIRVESSFVSCSEAAVKDISLIFPGDLAMSRPILLTGAALQAANVVIALPGRHYAPAALLLIPFENADCPCGLFVFAVEADSGRLGHCQVMLKRVAEMLTNRISTIHLLSELQATKVNLDRMVEERTRELSDAYRELEQEMAERMTAQEEQRNLEDQLRQSQKMESIGTLAGGVAHDFNNILTAIIGYGHLTLRKMEKDDPNRLNIEQMLESADRAVHLTKDLLLFSRKQPVHKKRIDLGEVIRKLQKFLIRVIGEDIAFKTRLPEGEIPVLADSYQIEQVLMNLAINARDAMPHGGVLTVAVEQVHLDGRFSRIHGYGRPGLYAMVTVSDTGEGMAEQTRQKIFEPFYTTKEVGKGTGLGLSVVYGIVNQHEGYIHVHSEPGIGTTFRIYLPFIVSGDTEENATVIEEQPVGGTETILLAEDNEIVRDLTVSVLREYGYTVITAVDGEDAVSRYEENKDSIQLLLFDLIMPRKSGKEAYDEIRRMRPDVKILFATGYSPDILADKTALGDSVKVVYKPISPVDLLKKVRSLLDKG